MGQSRPARRRSAAAHQRAGRGGPGKVPRRSGFQPAASRAGMSWGAGAVAKGAFTRRSRAVAAIAATLANGTEASRAARGDTGFARRTNRRKLFDPRGQRKEDGVEKLLPARV